jgi:hypothetical protein
MCQAPCRGGGVLSFAHLARETKLPVLRAAVPSAYSRTLVGKRPASTCFRRQKTSVRRNGWHARARGTFTVCAHANAPWRERTRTKGRKHPSEKLFMENLPYQLVIDCLSIGERIPIEPAACFMAAAIPRRTSYPPRRSLAPGFSH